MQSPPPPPAGVPPGGPVMDTGNCQPIIPLWGLLAAQRGFSQEGLSQSASGVRVPTRPPAGEQGQVDPDDVVESVLLVFRMSKNAVPEEIVLKAVRPGGGGAA